MRVTFLLDIEVENDEEAKELLTSIVRSDGQRIIKGNAYDPGQTGELREEDAKFGCLFLRHIYAVGGPRYGG